MSVEQLPPRRSGVGVRDAKLVRYDEYIDTQIGNTRRMVKVVDIATVLLVLAIGVLGFLLAAAVAEHWLVPGGFGTITRTVLFAVLAGGVGYYAVRRLWPPLVRPINPVYAAYTIEQGSPSLKNSLLNLLLFRQRRTDIADAVYETLEEQAAQRLVRVPVDAAVDRTNLVRLGCVLVAIVAVCALYKVLSPKDPLVTVERVLMPWSDVVPASRVTISNVEPGTTTLARGEMLEVSAEVRGIGEDDPVVVRYTTPDGQAIDKPVQLAPSAGTREFSGKIPAARRGESVGVAQDLRYRIEAGDARSKEFLVTVVAAPIISVERIDYDYPDYTGFVDRSVDELGDIRAIEGTRVTIHARANEPIEEAFVDFEADGRRDIQMNVEGAEARTSFVLAIRDDRKTPRHTGYVLRFAGTDGRANHDPVKYPIDVQPDQAPEVELLAPLEKTRDVRLDETVVIEVEARDPDFALSEVRLWGDAAGRTVVEETLLTKPHKGRFTGRFQFTPNKYRLAPGDVVRCWAVARDVRAPEPNEAASEPRIFRIVSPNPNAERQPPPDRIAQRDRRPQQPDRQQQPGGQQQPDGQQPGGQQNERDGQQQPGDQAQPGRQQQDQSQDGEKQSADRKQQNGHQPGNAGDESQQPGKQSDDQSGKGQPGDKKSTGEVSSGNQGSGNQSGQSTGNEKAGQGDKSQKQPGGNNGAGDKPGAKSGEAQSKPEQPGTERGENKDGKSADGNRNEDASGGNRAQKGQGKPRAEQNERPAPVSPEGDNDGEAFDRIRRFLDRQGKLSGDSKPSTDGSKETSNSESQPNADGKASPNNQAGRDADQKASQQDAKPNPNDHSQRDRADQNADNTGKGPGAETKPGEPNQKSDKPADPRHDSQSPGGQQTGSKGPAGAGDQPEKDQGSPDSKPGMKPAEKWQQNPSGEKSSDDKEPPAGGRGKRESDSQGDQGGDRAGGGQEGGGQRANREGTGSSGQNQSADEGAGESSEQGTGHNSPNAGKDAPAKEHTGQSGSEQSGKGSGQRDGEGDKPGGKSGGQSSPTEGAGGKSSEDGKEQQAGRDANQGESQRDAGQGESKGDAQRQKSQPGGKSSEDGKNNSTDQKSGSSTGPATGGGGGVPTGAGQAIKTDATAPEGDAANLEYARKQTDLVLETLAEQLKRKQVDKRLLDELGWTAEDLQRFIDRWNVLKATSRGDSAAADAARRELDDALRSLGLHHGPLEQRKLRQDELRDLREGYRGAVPLEYQERLRAYNEGVSRARPDGE